MASAKVAKNLFVTTHAAVASDRAVSLFRLAKGPGSGLGHAGEACGGGGRSPRACPSLLESKRVVLAALAIVAAIVPMFSSCCLLLAA
jgi:hypothetical protein